MINKIPHKINMNKMKSKGKLNFTTEKINDAQFCGRRFARAIEVSPEKTWETKFMRVPVGLQRGCGVVFPTVAMVVGVSHGRSEGRRGGDMRLSGMKGVLICRWLGRQILSSGDATAFSARFERLRRAQSWLDSYSSWLLLVLFHYFSVLIEVLLLLKLARVFMKKVFL